MGGVVSEPITHTHAFRAHPSVLAKIGATELDEAVQILEGLLPADSYPEVHENLFRARRDAIGRSDFDYQIRVLAGAFARLLAEQDHRISELEAKTAKRSKSHVAAQKK